MKEKPCRWCGNLFTPTHGLSEYDKPDCRRAAQLKYKKDRYAQGFTYRPEKGARYFPKPCANCADVFQPKSGRDRHCLACKQSREKWTEEVVSALLRSARRRRPIGFDLTREWFEKIWGAQDGRCAVSGVAMTRSRSRGRGNMLGEKGTKVSIDRVLSSGSYSQANCRLVCVAVNLMRGTLTDKALIEWCEIIAEACRGLRLTAA